MTTHSTDSPRSAASEDLLAGLGPLAPLAGTWEGATGQDVAPADDRSTEENPYRERMVFTPIGLTENHEQKLYGLRYETSVFRNSDGTQFHQEVGYYLWDPTHNQVMRSLLIPRGMALIAGGTVAPGATRFDLVAELGAAAYGITANPFLDREFKTVRFTCHIELRRAPEKTHGWVFSYEQDTQIQMPGRSDLFHHTDRNTLDKIESA